MRDLGPLTAQDFEACRGESFSVASGSCDMVFTVASVDRLVQSPGRRDAFSVLFDGPPAPILPQGLYRLEHPTMGELELFVVPIGADESAVTYEAVFS